MQNLGKGTTLVYKLVLNEKGLLFFGLGVMQLSWGSVITWTWYSKIVWKRFQGGYDAKDDIRDL